MTIVAISSELGSRGIPVGRAVAERLNFEFVDREIILQAASRYNVQVEALSQVDERQLSFWERFDEVKRRYLIFIESALLSFAERGNVVIRGRGAPLLLREIAHAFKVRITAPFEIRVRRVMEEEGVDQKTAQARVKAFDREQAARLEYLFGVDWTSPAHYDLVVNTERSTWDFYADLIAYGAQSEPYRPTRESIQKVKDLSLAASVKAALAADPTLGHLHLEVKADRGDVTLRGVVFSPSTMDLAAQVAKGVEGVKSVTCEVVEVPRIYPGPMM